MSDESKVVPCSDYRMSEQLTDPAELRSRLIRVIRALNSYSFARAGREINIGSATFSSFIRGVKKPQPRIIFAIEKWVIDKEEELGLKK